MTPRHLAVVVLFLQACSGAPGSAGSPGASAAGAAPGAAKNRAPEVRPGKYTRLLRGPDGVTLELVPLERAAGASGDDALIRVRGVRSEIDGRALPARREELDASGSERYVSNLHGEDRALLYKRVDGSRVSYRTWIPENVKKELPLTHDEKASVDVAGVIASYARQVEDGSLAELQRFDRAGRTRKLEVEMVKQWAPVERDCGVKIPMTIDWKSITDEMMSRMAISSYCSEVGDVMAEMCRKVPRLKQEVARIKSATCRFGDGEPGARLSADGELLWVPGEVSLTKLIWKTLRDDLDFTRIVLKAKDGLYLTFDAGDEDGEIHAGDGKLFHKVRMEARHGTWENRLIWGAGTETELDYEPPTWSLECGGDKKVALEELPRAEREKMLASAKLEDYVWPRTALALARDDRGTYYYVDRMLDEKGGKGFRVFIGPRGKLKPTALVDIVDDSHGMIFATRSGDLRLVIDDQEVAGTATWIRGDKHTTLVVLPVKANEKFIYDESGIYNREELGTLCEQL